MGVVPYGLEMVGCIVKESIARGMATTLPREPQRCQQPARRRPGLQSWRHAAGGGAVAASHATPRRDMAMAYQGMALCPVAGTE